MFLQIDFKKKLSSDDLARDYSDRRELDKMVEDGNIKEKEERREKGMKLGQDARSLDLIFSDFSAFDHFPLQGLRKRLQPAQV